ncbi:nucleotidyltransferase family protein [Caldibacillus lycopersici]|uniref:Nucleotidyltransferase family protein n=1 Tax=Perspicuibacillus lycopersici TaxID=1325689 RepID=A0AAE3IU97_9BACI|nr:nucleotidyltransferase family protein [Perspicuibacillus lycopersici]MCU9614750.1 nucleotidyltransferase family protein [Perspicuibacillus lycopersici]
MDINNEKDIIRLIELDPWMIEILKAAKTLQLPDWWICAGFVRSKIWDTLHDFTERTPLPDIDVVYFDQTNICESVEKQLEKKLRDILPDIPWSVKNEARMHVLSGLPPYSSTVDAIAKFTETVTALGVKLNNREEIILTAPHGIDDVIHMQVNPTPFYQENTPLFHVYQERLRKKNWKDIWYKLTINGI